MEAQTQELINPSGPFVDMETMSTFKRVSGEVLNFPEGIVVTGEKPNIDAFTKLEESGLGNVPNDAALHTNATGTTVTLPGETQQKGSIIDFVSRLVRGPTNSNEWQTLRNERREQQAA